MVVAKLVIVCYFAGLVSAVGGESSGANTTCEALRHLATQAQSLGHLGIPEVCNTTDSCLGIQCHAQLIPGTQTYSKSVLLPCQRPRAIHTISVFNDQLILDEVINQSKVFDYTVPVVGLVVQVNMTFENMNDSVLLGVEATIGQSVYPIVPLSFIPIDDNLCNGNRTVTTQAPPPPTLPTSPTQPKTACEAAKLLASEVPKQVISPILEATETCASFQNCSGVHCSAQYQFNNYSGKLYFLPCENPPALRLVLDDNTGVVHIDRVVNKNTTIPFFIGGISATILVTLIHQMDGSLLFALSALIVPIRLTVEIVPPTTIPMDRSSCPPPDSCMVWDTIADDLDALAKQNLSSVANVTDTCSRYDNCSGVACSLNVTIGPTSTFHLNMEVLPCLSPPAIHLLFADNSGTTYYDHNCDKSAVDSFRIPSLIGFFNVPVTLHVTLNQVPGAVAFALTIDVPLVSKVELVPLTEIPVDPSMCPTDEPTGAPPVVTPNRSIEAPAVAGITVGVIIGVAVLLLIAAAAVGFAIVSWLHRRRRVVELEPHMSFATKDYTDEGTVNELDAVAD